MLSSILGFISMALVYQTLARPVPVAEPLKRAIEDVNFGILSLFPIITATVTPLPYNYTAPALVAANFPNNSLSILTEAIKEFAADTSEPWAIVPAIANSSTSDAASFYQLDTNARAVATFAESVLKDSTIAEQLAYDILTEMKKTAKEVVCVSIETQYGALGGAVAGITSPEQQPQYGLLAEECGKEFIL